MLHIASHVFYKGCLFMVVGIVDHSTGVRDVRELGGLRKKLPLLAGITLIATASMAGIPGTLGFISKEYMLKAKLDYWDSSAMLSWYPLVLVVIASIMNVAFAGRICWGVFGGKMPEKLSAKFHAPGLALQLPPLLLGACCLVFGLMPAWLGNALHQFSTPGLHLITHKPLSIWHGVTSEFIMSVLIVFAGGGLYAIMQIEQWRWARVPRLLRFDVGFESALSALPRMARRIGEGLHFDRQFNYLTIAFGSLVLLLLFCGPYIYSALIPEFPTLADFDPIRSFVVALIAVAIGMTIKMSRWTSQLIALSIVGFLIMFYYVLFRAPDLAMTQILVESATLLLVLLLLARFPDSSESSEVGRTFSGWRQILNVVISIGVGVSTMLIALMAMRFKHDDPIGVDYLDKTVPLAYGTNTVNTILVDFRGFDTLLEAAVLIIACLGAIGLLMRYRRTSEEYAAGAMGPAGYGLGRKKEPRKEEQS